LCFFEVYLKKNISFSIRGFIFIENFFSFFFGRLLFYIFFSSFPFIFLIYFNIFPFFLTLFFYFACFIIITEKNYFSEPTLKKNYNSLLRFWLLHVYIIKNNIEYCELIFLKMVEFLIRDLCRNDQLPK